MSTIENIAKKHGFQFSWSYGSQCVVFHIYISEDGEVYTAMVGSVDYNYTDFEMVNYRDEKLKTRDVAKALAFLNAI